MADTYNSSLQIDAPASDVFRFAIEPANMPKYMPTTESAEMQGENRIRVKGEAAGHKYDSDGWFKKDESAQSFSWGSDGENDYSGMMQIQSHGEGSLATVELRFAPKPEMDAEFEKQMGSRRATIQTGLDAALQSLKNLIEGKGGKVKVPAETGS